MSDIAALVAENLDIWTSAIKRKSSARRGSSKKINLYGIERLRALILDLAVRGKLAPQDADDEPALMLLPKMVAERELRIKAKEIKKAKLPAKLDKEPFELPVGWTWIPLGQTGNIFTGKSVSSSVRSELERNATGRPFVATKDIGYGLDPIVYQNGLLVANDDERFVVAQPSTVFICAEGGSAGRKIAISDREITFGNKLIANEPWSPIEPRFILYTYLSNFFFDQFSSQMTGIIGGISRAKFLALPFPLPPLAEQGRIVAKVDELMALCDALERESEVALAAHQLLVETLLATLVNSTDSTDLATNWARLETHFDSLFTTEPSIAALEQTILDLAVRGKLVQQNIEEEAVNDLMKTILSDQAIRHKKKEIQKPKAVVSATVPSIEIPSRWKHVTLGNLAFVTKLAGFEYTKYISLSDSGEVPVVRAQNVRAFNLEKNSLKYIDLKTSETLYRSALDRPSILITFIGAGIGDVCQFNESTRWHLAPNVAKAEPFGNTSIDYLTLFLNSPNGRVELFKHMKSTAQPSLSMGTIREVWIPLPPLAEQKRIVVKVNELMALCEQLKSHLADAAETQRHLADAITQKAAA